MSVYWGHDLHTHLNGGGKDGGQGGGWEKRGPAMLPLGH